MKENYWIWHDPIIEADKCDEWVSRYDGLVEKGTAFIDEETDINSIRRSSVYFPREDDVMKTMFDLGRRANKQGFGFNLDQDIDCQFTRYDSSDSGFYNWHIDTYNPEQGLAYDRKISVIAMLSDPEDYEGGELHISNFGKIELKKGSVVCFPSFFLHRVTPVTSGTRYTMVAWLEGQHWR
jgi:PKHD-type hydroxylase